MKFLVIFVALFAFAYAETREVVLTPQDGSKLNLTEQFVHDFVQDLLKNKHILQGTTAQVNEYADKLLANIGQFIIHAGMDPMELPDLTQGLIPMGDLKLTHGWLQDTSTLKRYGDVIVSYDHNTKKFALTIPLLFDDLQFTYDYLVEVLLIKYDGGIIGKVKDLRINLVLGFDFNVFQASLDKFDLKNTGTLTLKFTGNALVDWLVNAISGVISTILHPIIVNIIQNLVKNPLNSVVDLINEIINSILHPTEPTTPSVF